MFEEQILIKEDTNCKMKTKISEIIGNIWTSTESYKNLQVLSDKIGPRFSGSKGGKKACDFILDKFKKYQLDKAYLDEFEYTSWESFL